MRSAIVRVGLRATIAGMACYGLWAVPAIGRGGPLSAGVTTIVLAIAAVLCEWSTPGRDPQVAPQLPRVGPPPQLEGDPPPPVTIEPFDGRHEPPIRDPGQVKPVIEQAPSDHGALPGRAASLKVIVPSGYRLTESGYRKHRGPGRGDWN